MRLYTIGHSTRSFKEFLDILKTYGIELLIDIRSWPHSERNPHFDRHKLKEVLLQNGIAYEWLGRELGGRRRIGLGRNSPNKGWRKMGFRNYADHTLSDEFKKGIKRLLELAEGRKTVLMCAEKLYWGCHRRILSDYLLMLGHRVIHIVDKERAIEHEMTPFAEIRDGLLVYPEEKVE